MSLTKEECVKARDIIHIHVNCDEMTTEEFNNSMVVYNILINEHFKIVKEKERLEKALDKACEELENLSYVKGLGQIGMCYKEWKEWCMKND